jgi:serine/threonine protein kinase
VGADARFVQEARAASADKHPNILTIHEVGEQDRRMFIVMERVSGKPLKELIPAKGMRLAEALRIAEQVADALTAAHAAGIVHGDLKPANIMVDPNGRVKVLDFALAKVAPSAPRPVASADANLPTPTHWKSSTIRRPRWRSSKISELTEGGYIARAEPVLLIGDCGAGKTYLLRFVAACGRRGLAMSTSCTSVSSSPRAGCVTKPY